MHGTGYVTMNLDPDNSGRQLVNELAPHELRAYANHAANQRMRRHGNDARQRITQGQGSRDRVVGRGRGHHGGHLPHGDYNQGYCHFPTMDEVRGIINDISTSVGEGFRSLGEVFSELRACSIDIPFWPL